MRPTTLLNLRWCSRTFHVRYHSFLGFGCGRCRKGGPLAVTDANLILGRLVPDYFPKIFGKSENEGLDAEASRTAFEKVAEQINASVAHNGEKKLDLDEIVYGWAIISLTPPPLS